MQWVRYLYMYFFDWQELFYFADDRGKIVAMFPEEEPHIQKWDKDYLQGFKAMVDGFCWGHYRILGPFLHPFSLSHTDRQTQVQRLRRRSLFISPQ
ncbi:---NA--- [Podarcis lilfordi]|uniref:---NA n=1 Tax=Podarcis lilfordi TaxID=74358 RepID=A0AA35NYF3_9SAUR|nr:---NA--- [Podarcis lilfordi]